MQNLAQSRHENDENTAENHDLIKNEDKTAVLRHDIHSPQESLDLPTVAPLVEILSRTLKKLAEQ